MPPSDHWKWNGAPTPAPSVAQEDGRPALLVRVDRLCDIAAEFQFAPELIRQQACISLAGRLSHLGDTLRAPTSDRPLRGHVLSALHDFVQEPFVRQSCEYHTIILAFPGGYAPPAAQNHHHP